ncbi:unnamed protein product [Strongylus vulgaris]|uniref:ABC transporter domain-containing protein n=1 Tax=Strongylus vulgaris TaxID=40348 RepID=A0A3P7KFX4_STRVU|nr:unnamed protein product [Strongylus vulgaris]
MFLLRKFDIRLSEKNFDVSTIVVNIKFLEAHSRQAGVFALCWLKETPILKGLSWYAKPGETVAFVGKSGCGKSTSVSWKSSLKISLLTRLYDCDKGTMTLDGRDIRSLKLTHLRKVIGIVQQEPCLFNGTIRENIVLGRNISDAKAEEAARIANAHDFILKLEKVVLNDVFWKQKKELSETILPFLTLVRVKQLKCIP